nr:hypothetical protein [Tanacetum cinerariifolium]
MGISPLEPWVRYAMASCPPHPLAHDTTTGAMGSRGCRLGYVMRALSPRRLGFLTLTASTHITLFKTQCHYFQMTVHQQSYRPQDDEEEEDEPVPTSTSGKTNEKCIKKMAKKTKEPQAEGSRPRYLGSQGEELLLVECFIQISEDPKVGSDQKYDTFWYKILDVYNEEAKKNNYPLRTKNMLTGKWIPMNRDVNKFNSLVLETNVMSEENDDDWMTRVEILYKTHAGSDFEHKSAWLFLKTSTSGKIPNRHWQDEIVFGLRMRNPSILEKTCCRSHPGHNELLRVNVRQTQQLVPVQTQQCFKK